MTVPGCERIALADLTDYAAGELPEAEAAALEEHLFSCAECSARAAEVDALVALFTRAPFGGDRRIRDGRPPEPVIARGCTGPHLHALGRRRRPLRRVGRR